MTDEQIEHLATLIHDQYCHLWHQLSRSEPGIPTQSDLATKTWDDLTEPQREANRWQARRYVTRLMARDLVIVEATDGRALEVDFDADEVDAMARAEHDGWAAQKYAAGWKFGTPRNDALLIHDLLRPWDELTEPQRELDRNPVRMMLGNLAAVGLAVAPLENG